MAILYNLFLAILEQPLSLHHLKHSLEEIYLTRLTSTFGNILIHFTEGFPWPCVQLQCEDVIYGKDSWVNAA